MAVYVAGDTHGTIDIRKLEKWDKGKKLTKSDILIILGDTGIVFDPLQNMGNDVFMPHRREISLWNKINSFPWTTLFIDGNHCNFDRLFSDEFDEIEMFGNKVKELSGSIYYLQRGRVYTIEDKTFFTFGGGASIDKAYRQPHVSWWEQEVPNMKEVNLGISQLQEYGNKVDFILTHSAPSDLYNEIAFRLRFGKDLTDEKPLTDFLDWVQENIEYKEWHFGHFHWDHNFDDIHFTHYNFEPRRII